MEPVELIKDIALFGIGIAIGQFNVWRDHKATKEQTALQIAAAKEQAKEQLEFAKQEQRKAFLAGVIMDPDIPRTSREPFYQEYISLGGNGPVLKLWASGK